jgi:hypothetical protein
MIAKVFGKVDTFWTYQKESKKHHPIAARGLGDAFGAGEEDLLPSNEEPFPLSLGQIRFFKF